ncbi:MAG: serine acetyltransferase [Saprospiraceae bacterium]|nr:serine acetyltransferase [Saprospiraceae bacterium]
MKVMNYRQKVEHFFQQTLDVLYPVRMGVTNIKTGELSSLAPLLKSILESNIEPTSKSPEEILNIFFAQILPIKEKLDKDITAMYLGDPSARNDNEIIITYPGFYAIAAYRIAHLLYQFDVPLIPRIITEHAHSYTGIDIHPGATIGEYLCIDHGTGVVVGETTVIGDYVKIYQGVTLGALSIESRHKSGQRHPTIENNVIIYAQATILGGKTVIGQNSIIGGNVWITKSVPKGSKVYYKESNQLGNSEKSILY